MRLVFLLLMLLSPASADTFIKLNPAVISHCTTAGLGSATVSWNSDGPGAVQVRIGSADGTPITTLLSPQGSAATGDIVTNGMVFILADAQRNELARTSAIVGCNHAGEILTSALSAAVTYFPLQAGNVWVYAQNSRVATSSYVTTRVVEADYIGEQVWFAVEQTASGQGTAPGAGVYTWYRNDDQGRIYILTSQGERLWLDPTTPADPSAMLRVTNKGGSVGSLAGTFQDGLSYVDNTGGLILGVGAMARGIGLVNYTSNILAGSSGGFNTSLNLVYAKIDGHVVFGSPVLSLELGTEGSSFDVTNKIAPNCAVPCYFVACGLVPGADATGTYKPCFQARVRLRQLGSDLQSCDLDLLDGSGSVAYHRALTGTMDAESTLFAQVPLYAPALSGIATIPLPTGNYQLRVQTPDGRMAVAPIQVK